MNKLKILVFLIFMCFYGFSQSHLDSLYSVWADNTKPDTIRAEVLLDYIYEGYFYTNPDSAIILANQLVEFTKNIDYARGTVDAYKLAGYIYFRTGDYPKALGTYQKGLDMAEKIDDKLRTADILLQIGYIYHDSENIITALQYYKRSLDIFEEMDDLDGIGAVYNEYGSIYRSRNEYEKALGYYQKSVAINEELGDEKGNSALFSNIGGLYSQQEDYDKALAYYQKAMIIDEQHGDKLAIAINLSGIGNVYSDQGNIDEALNYLQKSLTLSEQIDDAQGKASTLQSMGFIHVDAGKYSEAIKLCNKSLETAEMIGDIGNQEGACQCLYEANKALGNTKEALLYLEQIQLLTDSLQTEETAISLKQMEFSNQVLADSLAQVEKVMNIKLAHQAEVQQKVRNRNMAIGAGIFFLILAVGFFSRWRYIKKSKAIIEKERDRSENLLLNILPYEIAEELKEKGEAAARDYENVSILFSDFKGYTEKSKNLTAKELIDEINHCFKAFDHICEKYGIEKIKTIGDAYMAAGGLPVPTNDSIQKTVLAALEMQSFITIRAAERKARNEFEFDMRLGIHTGPVVAGIVGVKKFQYDIWGDTVNTASRMETNGEVGKVNISQYTYDYIKDDSRFTFASRGKIDVKGKGEMQMYFVSLT